MDSKVCSVNMTPIFVEKRDAKYSPGYRLQSTDDYLRFQNHRFYLITGEEGEYITLPHWWGENLTVQDAAMYIERGVYVAISRGE